MAATSRNLWQLGQTCALHSWSTQGMCVQNITEISEKLWALGPEQRVENTFWILLLLRRRLQTYQTHIGRTLHVGHNNNNNVGNSC